MSTYHQRCPVSFSWEQFPVPVNWIPDKSWYIIWKLPLNVPGKWAVSEIGIWYYPFHVLRCNSHATPPDNMLPCTGSRVNTNYERIASWGGCQRWTGDPRILETPLAAHCCSQRPNHSAMTHPSKRIGTSSAVSHTGYSSELKYENGLKFTFHSPSDDNT